ncbi:glycosyltransferase family 39 protein [Candidatus Sumerlaeota bacterium]|nr:glycosyltransferase family 39 protein [Candidatus Sumerlaeota bacterium]
MNFKQQARLVPREYWFLAVQVLAMLVYFLSATPLTLKDVAVRDEARSYAFTATEETATTRALMLGNWSLAADGATAGDADAAIEIPLPGGAWRSLKFRIIGSGKNEWVATTQRNYERNTRMKVFAGDEIAIEGRQLPGAGNPEGNLKLRIAARGEAGGRIERIHVRLSASEVVPALQPVPAVFFAALFPFAAYLLLVLGARRETSMATKAAAVLSILAMTACHFRADALRGLWIATAGLFLAAAGAPFLRMIRGFRDEVLTDTRSVRLVEVAATLALMGFALWTRWEALLAERLLPLRPDAAGYVFIALHGSLFQTALESAPWVREPLFPALLRCFFSVFSASETAARAASVFIGALVPVFTYVVGRKVFSPLGAFVAAGLLALNPFMATLSASALRDDLLSLLFLLLICAAISAEKFAHWRSVLIGVCAAGLALTRLSNLFVLLPIMGGIAWRQRWRWNEVAVCATLFVLPVVPHLMFNARIGGGDYFHSASVHEAYYLNRLHVGESGYPATVPEWNADPYRKVTSADSLLTSGGIVAGVRRIAVGYGKIFLLNFPHGMLFRGNELAMAFGLIGAWVLIRRREAWWMAGAYVIFMFPVAVIAAIVFDERLASPAAPLIALVWGAGVDFAIANSYAWIVQRKKKHPPSMTGDAPGEK